MSVGTNRELDLNHSGTIRTGQQGRCYNFDGNNDYVDCNGQIINTFTDLTISLWFKSTDSNCRFGAIKRTGASDSLVRFGITSSNAIFIELDDGTVTNLGFTGLNDGNWYNIIFTYDADGGSGNLKAYVNGYLRTTRTRANFNFSNVDSNFRIGSNYSNSGSFYDGEMFDFRIYSKVLTPSEVTHVYTFGGLGDDPGTDSLAVQYKMDEQSGTTAYDSSGNGNNGTLTNITQSTFHSTQDVYSFQNQVGYNLSGSVYIPRDESDTSNDVTGATLTLSGYRPNNFKYINSNCATGNGTDQYIEVPDNIALDITDNLTVCCWVKNDNATISSGTEYFVTKYDFGANEREWALAFFDSDKLIINFGDPSDGTFEGRWEATSSLTLNQWAHYAFTFDGGVVKLYVNGLEVAASATSGSIPSVLYNGTAPLTIFTELSSGSGANYWDGQISDVRIYSGASSPLTDANILDIYQNGTVDFENQTLAARYKLAEGAGTVAYDSSGSGNHGTFQNAGSNWGTLQDNVHTNMLEGFSLYEHASSNDLRVPYGDDGNPLTITPPTGYTKTSDNPNVDGHNNAETSINFNPDSTPEMTNVYYNNSSNGSDQFVRVNDDSLLDITDNLTVSIWAKHDSGSPVGGQTLISKYDSGDNEREWSFVLNSSQQLQVNFGDPSDGTFEGRWASDDSITVNVWHHYCFTFNSGVVQLYLDGQPIDGSTILGSIPATLNNDATQLAIFAFFSSNVVQLIWDGSIKEARIYSGTSAPLTDAQVLEVYNKPEQNLTFDGQSLVASYHLLKDTLDYSGNNLHGKNIAGNEGITFNKITVPAAYSFGDSLSSYPYNIFKREVSVSEEDRMIIYETSKEQDSNLSNIQTYTT